MEQPSLQQNLISVLYDSDINRSDIPCIDLYMDQIITLIQDKYASNRRFPEDKLLTKTMINNYSKEGIIKPIKGKKYSSEHIAQMLMIYSMKNTLSIQEIKSIFNGIRDEQKTLLESYDDYIELKKDIRNICEDALNDLLNRIGIDETNKTELLLLILGLSTMSSYMKSMAQNMIDIYFPVERKKGK